MVEVLMFDKPSGDVAGVATASVVLNGKQWRVAHAWIKDDGDVQVTLKVPGSKLTLESVGTIAEVLADFKTRLVAASSPPTGDKAERVLPEGVQ